MTNWDLIISHPVCDLKGCAEARPKVLDEGENVNRKKLACGMCAWRLLSNIDHVLHLNVRCHLYSHRAESSYVRRRLFNSQCLYLPDSADELLVNEINVFGQSLPVATSSSSQVINRRRSRLFRLQLSPSSPGWLGCYHSSLERMLHSDPPTDVLDAETLRV